MAEPKKKVRPGKLHLDPEEPTLVVPYEVTLELTGADGKREVLERKPGEKRIKVKTLNENSNIPLLAAEIIEKCKYIPESKASQVEELLHELLARRTGGAVKREGYAGTNSDREIMRRAQETSVSYGGGRSKQPVVEASIDKLDEYMEMLYDEIDVKVKATAKIAQLGRQTELMEVLASHESLLGALSRVLREEGRKSIDLTTNIISVFFSLSNFSAFHQVILANQIGDNTMRIIDLEVKRQEERERALSEKSAKGEKIDDALQKKLTVAQRKQEKLLYVCFYLLLNIAEDVNIERKMKKRNITVYLCKMLDRKNVDLLILCTTFLKKLSIYKENKDMMVECNIVEKLARFVPVDNEILLLCVLRLLHNLSFDPDLRDVMVRCGLIPKVVELIKEPHFQHVSMALLYHISMDDKCKSMFTYTDAIPVILDMLLQVQDLHQFPELIALAVNLTQNSRNAEAICEGDGLQLLLGRALDHSDPLAFKVIRNLSQQEEVIKLKFQPYIPHLVDALKDGNTHSDLLVEILGTLGNLNIPQFDYTTLVREHDLLSFLSQLMQPGVVEDDIMLEVVIFTGTLTNDYLAQDVVDSGLCEKMYHLMSEKKEDDEFVLQISFTFHRFMLYDPTRDALLRETKVVYYLVDLLQDKNKQVRKTADMALDIVMDSDEGWAEKVRELKFETHNQEWLEMVEADQSDPNGAAQQRMMHAYGMDEEGAEMDDGDGPLMYDDGAQVYEHAAYGGGAAGQYAGDYGGPAGEHYDEAYDAGGGEQFYRQDDEYGLDYYGQGDPADGYDDQDGPIVFDD
mmetsp:Transcript_22516/g.76554  ORF Transcript_22516/g.76554 Transcript_22516/m.76554 type:complete len:799 (+) Transcript_22516:38-2434(+)